MNQREGTVDFIGAQQQVLDTYGVAADSTYVTAPSVGGQAHVLVAGSGPPVLMVNGIGLPAALWAPLMGRLGGYRIHAVDLPGFGLTDTMPSIADDLRTTAVAFLGEVLDGLCLDRPVIIGNSLGSLWSMWFAERQPDRVGALVHVACPALVLGTSAPLPMRLAAVPALGPLLARLDAPSPAQVKRLSRAVGEHPLPPELARLLLAAEQLPGHRPTLLAMLRALLRLRGARPGMAMTAEQLTAIDVPTLCAFARSDPFGGPKIGRRMVEALPRAELAVVDGGHAPWFRYSDQVGSAIDRFLTPLRSEALGWVGAAAQPEHPTRPRRPVAD